MKTINLVQGSPDWHAHRAKHFNASDAPAMLGESPYKTRDQLLHELATGEVPEFDAGTQKRFDDGHIFEALARPLAEKLLDEPLYPVIGVQDIYSASFDGITMDESICFEHKTLNKTLSGYFNQVLSEGITGEPPIYYAIQMEQQLMISGAQRCLFMATKWEESEVITDHEHKGRYYTLVAEKWIYYTSDPKLRKRIVAGWEQFAKDLAVYTPKEVKEKVVAQDVETLPTPLVVAHGSLVQSNLGEITPLFDSYFENTKVSGFETEQEFADAKANGKNCREMAKALKLKVTEIIAQTTDVNDAIKVIESYAEKFNAMGLKLEKAVEAEEKAIKEKAITNARNKFSEHITGIQKKIDRKGITFHHFITTPDFVGAIKGVRTQESMHTRLNDALTKGILEADDVADKILANLAYLDENTKGYENLFHDAQSFIDGDIAYIELLVEKRINSQKQVEAEREAENKKREELLKLHEKNIEASDKAFDEMKEATQTRPDAIKEIAPDDGIDGDVIEKPTAEQMVGEIAFAYGVELETALSWLVTTDFSSVQLKKAA